MYQSDSIKMEKTVILSFTSKYKSIARAELANLNFGGGAGGTVLLKGTVPSSFIFLNIDVREFILFSVNVKCVGCVRRIGREKEVRSSTKRRTKQ